MEKFELHILGCGSALPTTRHFATSQVVNLREKLFMIDCGEGAQMQLRRSRLKFSRLNHIFISHLHGDHCFGLLGLISTFGLLGRTADLHIHSPEGLEELFAPMLAFFCKTLTYKVLFHEFETKEPALIYDDRSVTVTTILNTYVYKQVSRSITVNRGKPFVSQTVYFPRLSPWLDFDFSLTIDGRNFNCATQSRLRHTQ